MMPEMMVPAGKGCAPGICRDTNTVTQLHSYSMRLGNTWPQDQCEACTVGTAVSGIVCSHGVQGHSQCCTLPYYLPAAVRVADKVATVKTLHLLGHKSIRLPDKLPVEVPGGTKHFAGL